VSESRSKDRPNELPEPQPHADAAASLIDQPANDVNAVPGAEPRASRAEPAALSPEHLVTGAANDTAIPRRDRESLRSRDEQQQEKAPAGATAPANARQAAASTRERERRTIEAAQRGDAVAWSEIVNGNRAVLRRILAPKLSPHDADDVIQDTFLKAVALDRFDVQGTAALSTWLGTIASNLALNQLRQEEVKRRKLALLGLAWADRAACDTADERAHYDELSEALTAAVESLSPQQRRVFLLQAREGMSNTQIADALGLKLTTVGTTLYRARRKLQKWLHPWHPAARGSSRRGRSRQQSDSEGAAPRRSKNRP